eukprot:4263734-Prymnesium_polylepis.1
MARAAVVLPAAGGPMIPTQSRICQSLSSQANRCDDQCQSVERDTHVTSAVSCGRSVKGSAWTFCSNSWPMADVVAKGGIGRLR